ncbi:MAG: glycosyltransferase family 9 protein, partial [Candidatus Omnitrophica bacterium]|nr:glycosyltransferase family 9 protein [Candidatus Omnitrophota bacterium]
KTVVIAPGARSDIKKWPWESYALLADRLIELDGVRLLWIGDDSDRALIQKIQERMTTPSQNCAGQNSWRRTQEIILEADLVITNDSAPLHLADELGRKVMAFFGPTDPAKYGPQRTPSGVLFRGVFCSPCERAQCRYQHECLREIRVDEAYQRAHELLESTDVRVPGEVLAVRLDRMGDMMLSYPAFAALKSHFERDRLTVLARPYTLDAAGRSGPVNDVIVYDYAKGGRHRSLKGYARLVREIRRRRFKAAFIFHPTFRSHLLCLAAGIPVRVGYRPGVPGLLTHTVTDLRSSGYQHESRNALDVARAYGVRSAGGHTAFRIYPEDRRRIDKLLGEAGLLTGERVAVLHPGSSSRSKCWPIDSFVRMGEMLIASYGVRIAIIGDGRHKRSDEEVAIRLGVAAVNLSGKTDMALTAALLERSLIFVSNDSGPAHLAAAVGTRVVSIFGRSEPGLGARRWKPMGETSAYVQGDSGCVVCTAEHCSIEFECLKQLTPEHVFEAVEGLMKDPPS